MTSNSILIAIIITAIIAAIIEGTKGLKLLVRRRGLAKKRVECGLDLISYIASNSDSFDYDHATLARFSDLILRSYLIYISKMAETLTKSTIHYDLDEGDECIYFIDGFTTPSNRKAIRSFIKYEIDIMLSCNISYKCIRKLNKDGLDEYIEHAIDFIEKDFNYQMVCSNTVIEML